MSNIKADKFTWKSGESGGVTGSSVNGDQVVFGVAKSWASFTTITTTTMKASFNVSSLTDNGTGDTTVTFANAFSDANYSFTLGTYGVSSGAYSPTAFSQAPATNNIRIISLTSGGVLGDVNTMCVSINR